MPIAKTIKMPKTETEVAVLQVQVKNIESDVSEIKTEIRDVKHGMTENMEETKRLLHEMKEASSSAHKAMSDKITSLEKWRWMMMGAGVVIGSLGFDTLGKLLK